MRRRYFMLNTPFGLVNQLSITPSEACCTSRWNSGPVEPTADSSNSSAARNPVVWALSGHLSPVATHQTHTVISRVDPTVFTPRKFRPGKRPPRRAGVGAGTRRRRLSARSRPELGKLKLRLLIADCRIDGFVIAICCPIGAGAFATVLRRGVDVAVYQNPLD
jgi:hypothetical protein